MVLLGGGLRLNRQQLTVHDVLGERLWSGADLSLLRRVHDLDAERCLASDTGECRVELAVGENGRTSFARCAAHRSVYSKAN